MNIQRNMHFIYLNESQIESLLDNEVVEATGMRWTFYNNVMTELFDYYLTFLDKKSYYDFIEKDPDKKVYSCIQIPSIEGQKLEISNEEYLDLLMNNKPKLKDLYNHLQRPLNIKELFPIKKGGKELLVYNIQYNINDTTVKSTYHFIPEYKLMENLF